ncbi:hypothetical protein Bca52824_093538 [Brassica carinata]|uniref:RING-type E3 ubiquitin transferase n=1 Tax=Brassica carinata TaxID=52824 RepID=A0A8X7TLM0_BRACI|nr:hypothetical protein Bca52824_093538 [Brassica carinata]
MVKDDSQSVNGEGKENCSEKIPKKQKQRYHRPKILEDGKKPRDPTNLRMRTVSKKRSSNEHLKKAKKIRRQDASVQTKGPGLVHPYKTNQSPSVAFVVSHKTHRVDSFPPNHPPASPPPEPFVNPSSDFSMEISSAESESLSISGAAAEAASESSVSSPHPPPSPLRARPPTAFSAVDPSLRRPQLPDTLMMTKTRRTFAGSAETQGKRIIRFGIRALAAEHQVCKHPFSFSPVYAENAPTRLPFQEFVVGIAMKACHVLQFFLRLSFVLSVWLLTIPFITFWIWRLAFVRSFGEAQRLFLSHISTTVILTDCLHGFLLSASIVFIFLGATSLRDYFRHLRELGGQDEREDEGERNGVRAARRPAGQGNRNLAGEGNVEDAGDQGAGVGQVNRRNPENVLARLDIQAARLEAQVEQMFDGLDDAD